MKIVMAKTAAILFAARHKFPKRIRPWPPRRQAVQTLATGTHATGGLILLDRDGNPGWAFNTPRMAYGYVQTGSAVFTAV